LEILLVWIVEWHEAALAVSAFPLGGAAAALGAWARWALDPIRWFVWMWKSEN
jgi:hypothetical protein